MRAFLTAQWRNLLMLNYEVAPELLRPHVPAGTELDHHDARVWASVVGFRFLGTRVLGVPIPFHRDFTELNLRCYVRRGERRGVVFIREAVPRALIAMTARLVYNEPYVRLPLRSTVSSAVRHEWKLRGRWHALSAVPAGDPVVPAPGSHEEFITDHAWGYTRQRNGGTIEYHVEHQPWPVRRVTNLVVDADFRSLYGSVLGGALTRPASAFLVDGSPVTVGRPVRV